ncbi:MAG: hypothetical protein AAF483_28460 [Planctomycetota bacterium]
MSEMFFENPVWIGAIGFGLAFLAGIAWTQVDELKIQKGLMYGALGIAVGTLLLVMLNIQVQTETELIRETLHDVAASLEKNDHRAIERAIHPNASEAVQSAKKNLKSFEFEDARVTRIKSIDINESKPPTALAQINVVVDVNLKGTGKGRGARFVKVYFMKKDDRWLVQDFEQFEPTAGFRDSPVTTPGL